MWRWAVTQATAIDTKHKKLWIFVNSKGEQVGSSFNDITPLMLGISAGLPLTRKAYNLLKSSTNPEFTELLKSAKIKEK